MGCAADESGLRVFETEYEIGVWELLKWRGSFSEKLVEMEFQEDQERKWRENN